LIVTDWLDRVGHFLEKSIYPVSRFLHHVGQWVVVLMVLLTVTDVCLRYIFNSPILGSYEITQFMMAILIFASVGYTMAVKEHVSVDLVITKLPKRVRALLEAITCVLACGLFAVAAWRTVVHVGTTWKRHDVSADLFIPVSPFVLFVALGLAVLSLVLLVQFIQSLARVLKK
jgi:TRAP-type C4-dicarboxylate transport system permease small subunit